MKHFCIGVLSFLLLTMAHVAAGDIYRYVDEHGITHFTNVPMRSDVKYALIYRERRVQYRISPRDVAQYDQLIMQAAEKHGIESSLIKAVIKAESNFNHRAISPKGAQGLMQLMPQTASSLHVSDAFHAEHNIDAGTRYLRYLIDLFQGNLSLALAAYNAGENAVIRYGGIPPYRETQAYVKRVLSALQNYRGEAR